MPPAFWEWFSDRQRELNLNDSAVARLAGIAASVISKARSEEQAIGPEALEKIADALKTPRGTVYRLVGRIEQEDALSPEQQLWLTLLADLDEFDREELIAIAKVRAKRRGRREQPATTG